VPVFLGLAPLLDRRLAGPLVGGAAQDRLLARGAGGDVILAFDPARDHITRKYEQAAALIGASLVAPRLGFAVTARDMGAYAGYPKRVFDNFFGSVPDKSFTVDAMRAVLARLADDFSDKAFLVCYMRQQSWIVELVSDYTNVDAVRTDIGPDDLYAAIQACDAVMTVDTSIAHIAAVLGKPLLDIFCRAAQARINFQPVGIAFIVESSSPDLISDITPNELARQLSTLLSLV
jgi:hypothetical protein